MATITGKTFRPKGVFGPFHIPYLSAWSGQKELAETIKFGKLENQ